MNLTREQAEIYARQYTSAWCSHDPDAVAPLHDEDDFMLINDCKPSRGRGQIAARARVFHDTFPDLAVKMDDVRSSGTRAVYRWTLKGTHSGQGGTDNRVTASGWAYGRSSADGLVAESAGQFDAVDDRWPVDGDCGTPCRAPGGQRFAARILGE